MIDELTSDGIVRLFLKKQLPHVDRMEEWEKQHNLPHPGFERGIELLLDAAIILQENELRKKYFTTQLKADIPVLDPQPSEGTQRPAKLTDLERQRRREVWEEVKTQLKTKEGQVN